MSEVEKEKEKKKKKKKTNNSDTENRVVVTRGKRNGRRAEDIEWVN